MKFSLKLIIPVGALAVTLSVLVPTTVEAAQPIQGYQCMALNLTPAQMADNSVNVPILSDPKSGAAHVANATSVVLVKAPIHEVDGYDEVLRLNGKSGWVSQSSLKTWHSPNGSNEKCVPALMSTGRYGFVTSN
jgi:hypothetical protein